ncbi:hypothetical protein [Psychrobacillus antarcticus]|uniref:hypothetical protein n=1 Tax=Psychrobacillus antarcticus TaxID=2879115 RepID=UPI002407A8E6|nr:hypothetical protein [Psychrobacillus antarcticus]
MSNGEGIDQNNQNSDTEIHAVHRAVMDALTITIGDAISAISILLGSEEDYKEQQGKIDNLKNMIQQVNDLTEKVKTLNQQIYKNKDIV